MIRTVSAALTSIIVFGFVAPICAQEYSGIGIAQTLSDVEVVQGRLDVNTPDELVLVFFDEFGLVDASQVFLDSNGNFVSFTSSLWIAANSSTLSAVLMNVDTGESMGDVAISMIGSPTPSAVMTADDVRNIVNGLLPGHNSGIRIVPNEAALDNLFDQLTQGGTESTPPTYGGIGVVHPDGTWIGIRPDSSSGQGDSTIDIRYPNGSTVKVHIDSCSTVN